MYLNVKECQFQPFHLVSSDNVNSDSVTFYGVTIDPKYQHIFDSHKINSSKFIKVFNQKFINKSSIKNLSKISEIEQKQDFKHSYSNYSCIQRNIFADFFSHELEVRIMHEFLYNIFPTTCFTIFRTK